MQKGNIAILALVIGGLALLGVISTELKIPPLGSGGETVDTGITSGGAASVSSLTVTGTATSSFSGGIDVLTVGGIETQSGLVVTAGDLLLTGLLKSNNTGTSSYTGGLSVSTNGGLSTVSGLTITGGSLLGTDIGAKLGSTTLTGLNISTNGLSVTGAGFFLNGVNITGTGTSTASDFNIDGLTLDTNGLTVTAGRILATNIGATFGSTSVGGITSANGFTLTAGCFLGPNGTCIGGGGGLPAGGTIGQVVTNTSSGAGSWQDSSFGILMCNIAGGLKKQCRVITDVASGTIAITGIPATDFLSFRISVPGMIGTSSPTLSFNGATTTNNISQNIQERGGAADELVSATTTMQLDVSSIAASGRCGDLGCYYEGDITGTSTVQKMFVWEGVHWQKGQAGVQGPRWHRGQGLYDNTSSAIHEIKFTCAQDGTKCDPGTEIIISGYRNAP